MLARRSMVIPILGFIAATAANAQPPAQPAAPAAAAYEPPIVLTHQEPHHRQVFHHGTMRILDLRVPPNDVTWYHKHEWPVLYVSFSGSQIRTDNLGEDDENAGGASRAPAVSGAPAAPAAPASGAPASGAPPASAAPAPPRGGAAPVARGGPGQPAARATSTTSYFDKPITHRLENIGTGLVRAMVVINETAGDDTTAESAAGFAATPELSNKWFRSYRRTLAPGESLTAETHGAPVAIIQATAGKGVAQGPMTFELSDSGDWAFFDAGVSHTLRNLGDTPLELLEIELRYPR